MYGKSSQINTSFDGAEIKVYINSDTMNLKLPSPSDEQPINLRYIHTHFTYEIFFVTQGSLTVTGEDFNKTFERSVIIIPPRFKHYTVPDSKGGYCLLFSVTKSSFQNIRSDSITDFPMTDDIAFYINKLAQKVTSRTKTADQDCKCLTLLLFSELSESVYKDSRIFKPRQFVSENISRIDGYINSHIGQRFTLEDLSRAVFLSTRQVSRIIEKEYSKSFVELVTEKRLAAAEMFLKNTTLKISDIAARTFPENANYFYTLFKKKHGTTPLNYRKQMKNTPID